MVPFADFEMYIRGKSIAVVGASAIESPIDLSNEIDAHDIVVRINSYEKTINTKNFGSKFDVLCSSFYEKHGGPKFDNFDFPKWLLNTHPLKIRHIDNSRCYENSMKINSQIPHSMFPDITISMKSFPTSGTWVIAQFLKLLKSGIITKLSIYGISLNLRPYSTLFNGHLGIKRTNTDKFTIHDYSQEREYIKKEVNQLDKQTKEKLFIQDIRLNEFINT